ncbi:glycerol-3-phosphate phosphatase [Stomoxys calcitrans]|uniref:4-nitrophenylphosphatase n=1 Tax=Stomoxys calcitrans TaxID=35570 RepID=A0A1I8PIV8_STOCA|nr:glycerol-3-phosphate phosphatase [Stomoxys calcitrans]
MLKDPINLDSEGDKQRQANWLESYNVILTDCDGVLWYDDEVIAGVPETINALQAKGKKIYFVTNNGTKTRAELCEKARRMNFNIEETQIIAPTFSIAEYLKLNLKRKDKVYAIGSSALGKELAALEIPFFGLGPDPVKPIWVDVLQAIDRQTKSDTIGAVVVAFDEHISYNKLMKASNFLGQNEKCLFLATNADAVSKFPMYCIPGTGAILKAIETCVGREALIMGKPNPLVCEHLVQSGKIKPERALMIGDCYKTDVSFGKNCGFSTLLVGTGRYKWNDVEELVKQGSKEFIPNFYISSLSDLKAFL